MRRDPTIAGLFFSLGISCSDAGPCSNDIELIANEMSQSDDPDPMDSRSLGTKPPSRAAVRVKMRSDPRFTAAMDRARSLDAEGNPACMKVVREIKNLVSD
jgi:hypothetical protein